MGGIILPAICCNTEEKMLSVPFKKGFWRGFASPTNIFTPSRLHFPDPVRLEDAWAQVGRSMAAAMGVEGGYVDRQKHAANAAEYLHKTHYSGKRSAQKARSGK
ncbi:hypothetical protein DPQ22_03560 [Candidatus Tokpelaia sp.]|nr:hypothetical protein DPQ22_03560 [Candidatus Tokpelaia sp.]